MPADVFGGDGGFLPRRDLLTFEEIVRLARLFVDLGVRKIRLTGGEPLVRRGLPELVAALSSIEPPPDLAITTNGSLLASMARPLRDAGLGRVTVSLDSLEPGVFRAMSGSDCPVGRVVDGIRAARAAGLEPVKVNMVVKRGTNEGSVLPMVRFARAEGVVLRLIEYMDVGTSNGWRPDDVVPAHELIATVDAVHALEPLRDPDPGAVAMRYRFRDGAGEMGVIAAVSRPFCGGCSRIRLTAGGQLFTCLFSETGLDLRAPLRAGATDGELRGVVAAAWAARGDRYSEARSSGTTGRRSVEMFRLGG